MKAIQIPQLLRAADQAVTLEISDYLSDLETLTPVQGTLRVVHRGSYLEVSAKAEAIATLPCDRCLQHYNHRLLVDTTELIWLSDAPRSDTDLLDRDLSSTEDLVETLSPLGEFQPDRWLYEQFCLEIPPRKLCDRACPGIDLSDSLPASAPAVVDHRWASLEALRNQLN